MWLFGHKSGYNTHNGSFLVYGSCQIALGLNIEYSLSQQESIFEF